MFIRERVAQDNMQKICQRNFPETSMKKENGQKYRLWAKREKADGKERVSWGEEVGAMFMGRSMV